ncbi:hypothetical protein [Paenibacillus paridis]|uniref:hypothetical protein n=1 Tax=Paenibacillus paridis TaxID=2583376 RepID=UPI001123F401|nr:hypothetical protein [Paenibacillus paridis]
MKMDELKSKLGVTDSGKIYLPNEIFSDLVGCEDIASKATVTPHISFAYSYIYLCYYLYWTCKWYVTEKITQDVMKNILGYSSNNKTLNYIIKKNGVIDQLGYTKTTTDFPMGYSYEEENIVEFETFNSYKKNPDNHALINLLYPNERNFTIKYPTKAFHRTTKSDQDRLLDGTFYEVDYTHHVPIEVFIYCMSEKDIGVIGFYLYSFLKHKEDVSENGAMLSLNIISQETGIKATSLVEYFKVIKKHNMIDYDVKPFVFGLPTYLQIPNTYWTKEASLFGEISRNIKTRTVMSLQRYEDMYGEIEKDVSIRNEKNEMFEFAESLFPY